jgi:hypothetical protein
MFGYGRGAAHRNAHTWGRFKAGLNHFSNYQYKQNANEKLIVSSWGFTLTLKGMKLLSNKP